MRWVDDERYISVGRFLENVEEMLEGIGSLLLEKEFFVFFFYRFVILHVHVEENFVDIKKLLVVRLGN